MKVKCENCNCIWCTTYEGSGEFIANLYECPMCCLEEKEDE